MKNIIKEMKSYFDILISFWISSFSIEVEYKLNFWIELISVIGNLIGSIFLLSLFYSNDNNLGGWSWSESLIVMGIYTLLESYSTIFLQPNLRKIVSHVQNGTLDFILLKPISSQVWLSFRIISPWGVPSFISGLLIITYGSLKSSVSLSLTQLIIVILSFFAGLVILYSMWFMLATTSIWFVKVWNANEVLRATLVAGRYPISSYPPLLRFFFTFIMPIAFLTTFPAEALLGAIDTKFFIISIIFSLIFLLLSNLLWRYALRYYTSASS